MIANITDILHIKAHFAGDNRKFGLKYHLQPTQYKYFSLFTNPAGRNIIFNPPSRR